MCYLCVSLELEVTAIWKFYLPTAARPNIEAGRDRTAKKPCHCTDRFYAQPGIFCTGGAPHSKLKRQ